MCTNVLCAYACMSVTVPHENSPSNCWETSEGCASKVYIRIPVTGSLINKLLLDGDKSAGNRSTCTKMGMFQTLLLCDVTVTELNGTNSTL